MFQILLFLPQMVIIEIDLVCCTCRKIYILCLASTAFSEILIDTFLTFIFFFYPFWPYHLQELSMTANFYSSLSHFSFKKKTDYRHYLDETGIGNLDNDHLLKSAYCIKEEDGIKESHYGVCHWRGRTRHLDKKLLFLGCLTACCPNWTSTLQWKGTAEHAKGQDDSSITSFIKKSAKHLGM